MVEKGLQPPQMPSATQVENKGHRHAPCTGSGTGTTVKPEAQCPSSVNTEQERKTIDISDTSGPASDSINFILSVSRELSRVHRNNELLTETNHTLERKLEYITNSHDKVVATNHELADTIHSLRIERDVFKLSEEKARKLLAQAEGREKQCKDQLAGKETELLECRKDRRRAVEHEKLCRKERNEIQVNYNKLSASRSNLDTTHKDLKHRFNKLQDQYDALGRNFEEANRKLTASEKASEKAVSNHEEQLAKIKDLQVNYTASQSEMLDLRDQLSTKTTQLSDLATKLSDATATAEMLTIENTTLKQRLTSTQDGITAILTHSQQVSSENIGAFQTQMTMASELVMGMYRAIEEGNQKIKTMLQGRVDVLAGTAPDTEHGAGVEEAGETINVAVSVPVPTPEERHKDHRDRATRSSTPNPKAIDPSYSTPPTPKPGTGDTGGSSRASTCPPSTSKLKRPASEISPADWSDSEPISFSPRRKKARETARRNVYDGPV